uniref:TATA-binding protein-associated factor 172 (Trinotate prediction) n=1 Tax=Henneguya salminicola TaxID=69463 RepID=A0A6G3MDN9_HENSL
MVHLNRDVLKLSDILIALIKHDSKDWRIILSCITAFKYLLLSCENNSDTILLKLYPQIYKCLSNQTEDVIMASCQLLNTFLKSVVVLFKSNIIDLIHSLTNLIVNADELTSTVSSVVELLSRVLSFTDSSVDYCKINDIFMLNPNFEIQKFYLKLLQLCQHSSLDVRTSTIMSLAYIVKYININVLFKESPEVPKLYAYVLFYITLTQPDQSIRDHCQNAFSSFLETLTFDNLDLITRWWCSTHIKLLSHPSRTPILITHEFANFHNVFSEENNCVGGYQIGATSNSFENTEIDCRISASLLLSKLIEKQITKFSSYVDSVLDISQFLQSTDYFIKYSVLLTILEVIIKHGLCSINETTLELIRSQLFKELSYENMNTENNVRDEIFSFINLLESFKVV